jgi:hypothetical protein
VGAVVGAGITGFFSFPFSPKWRSNTEPYTAIIVSARNRSAKVVVATFMIYVIIYVLLL